MELEDEFKQKFSDVKKLVILGVGNIIRSDDGVGSRIVQELEGKLNDKVVLIDTGTVPESFTSVVRRANPSHILIIDAAGFLYEPGHIAFIEKETITGVSFSTHQMPLSLLWEFLESEVDAKIYLLGIQPESNELGEELSPPVIKAKNKIINLLLKLFKK
ncbi:MAG: hydrogenase maturation peptidase HycI [Candidatus Odinarchaeia archaeon]